MRIESIQVGKPRAITSDWTSAIYKTPVTGSVMLNKYNLEGDKQADLSVHGGLDKAVNVYPIEHYSYWNQRARLLFRRRINLPAQHNGSFGENFTVSNLNEKTVCIGDSFEVGAAIVQVTQPRQPCWKLARKFNQAKLPFWVQETGKTGWYFRVIQEGPVKATDNFTLLNRESPSWSVERASHLMHSPTRQKHDVISILECESLSNSWKKTFEDYLSQM